MIKKIFHEENRKKRKYKKVKKTILIFFVVLFLLTFYFLYNEFRNEKNLKGQTAVVYPADLRKVQRFFNIFDEPEVGEKAHLFKLDDTRGEEFDLGAKREKKLLIIFEGVNCPSCVVLEKDLNKVQDDLQDELDFITVSVERDENKILEYKEEYDVERRWLIDELLRVSLAYRVQSVPAFFIVAPDNTINFISYDKMTAEGIKKAFLFN